MGIYLSILCLCVLYAIMDVVGKEKYPAFFSRSYLFFFFVFFLFSALRYDVGVDYLSYYKLYEESVGGIHEKIKEPGGAYLFYYLKEIGIPFFVVNALYSFFILCFAFKFIWRYSPYPFVSLLLFYAIGQYYFNTFNAIRQAFVVYLFMDSLNLVVDKRKWIYGLRFIAAAFFVHLSALMLIPLYFFLRRKYNVWLKIVFLGVLVLSSGLIIHIIGNSVYAIYLKMEEFAAEAAATTYLFFLFSIFFFIIDWKLPKYAAQSNILSNLNYLSLVTLTLVLFFAGTPLIMVANRFSYYFTPIYIVLIPIFISKLRIYTNRTIVVAVSVLFFSLLCYWSLYANGEANNMIPYQSIFNS